MLVNSIPNGEVKAKAIELGFTTAGVCRAVGAPHLDYYRHWLANQHHGSMKYLEDRLPIRADPSGLLQDVRSIVAVSLNYNQPNPGTPRIARYALGRDYHKVMKGKLRRLASWISERYPGSEHRACVDSAPLFERDYARLAGLGWFGKNTCLIDSKRGSWFFIGILLTTFDFEPDLEADGGCGTCTKCIDACPTGAIVFSDGRWQVDSRRCISYWTIEHKGPLEVETHGWLFGCDVCQEVCPFNQPRVTQPLRAQTTTEADFLERTLPTAGQDLIHLTWSDWDRITRGSPIRRAGYEGLKRNALSVQSRGM